ncbi:MAG: cytochrome b/b6 domain-containing protein [Proteobacteria bacterium]|nr:cytochrome b/b6 domain-containing protein [Pseudomonadota bacterium]
MAAVMSGHVFGAAAAGHSRAVRVLHWFIAASVLTLAFSGFVILMAHPRLYWGNAGNDLTPPLIELPIGRNYKHGGWAPATTFQLEARTVVSEVRTYDIFNKNGWARSLHFLAAWFLALAGSVYVAWGIGSGHLWTDIIPRLRDFSPRRIWDDIRKHLRLSTLSGSGGLPYGILQKLTYAGVLLIALPLMVLTGLTMSPAITASYPELLDLFGGSQSARTIHFIVFAGLVLFVVVHVVMVVLTGFKRQLRAMTIGS